MAKADQPEPSELDEHPGRPRGRDEIDPELVVLPRPRPRIGWLLALSVLVFCAFFLWRLRADLAFSRQADAPERLASIEAAIGAEPDRYVEIEAVPDRASLLRVSATDAGHRLAPVLGSGDRLWIMFAGNHWYEPNSYAEVYKGRVKRLGDLPFYDQLVGKLGSMAPVPRIVSLEALTDAVASNATTMKDVAGDAMALSPETEVVVSERVAGKAHVTGFDTELLHDEQAWRSALVEAGVLSPDARLIDQTLKSWTFETDASEGIEALSAKLVAAKLYAARAEPLDIDHHTTWAALASRGQALVLTNEDSSLEVPLASIRSVAVMSRRSAPASARVVLTTDEPDDYWYVLPLYIVFGVFALLFGWALWRALRPQRVEQPAS